jgi:hypothetical protein
MKANKMGQARKRWRVRIWALALFVGAAAPFGCSAGESSESLDPVGSDEQRWDSAGGNPTHATHSYMTEYAVQELRHSYPDVYTYRADLIAGANAEIHDLPINDDANAEQIRRLIGGNNWGCEHPDYVWYNAKYYYAKGDKHSAYWFLGLLLHYVQDAGVPAHGFHVVHQNRPWNWDNFEVQSTLYWDPSFSKMNRVDPRYAAPDDYVNWTGNWAIDDFSEAYPGGIYHRAFFKTTPFAASKSERLFVRRREGRTSMAVKWALTSAMTHWK